MTKIILPIFKNKKIAVLGLGLTGISAINALLRSEAEEIIIWDDDPKKIKKIKANSKIKVRNLNHASAFSDLTDIIITPSFSPDHPIIVNAKSSLVTIHSDLDLLYLSAKSAKFIGITGTNGKSTTAFLIEQVLKKAGRKVALGGNIGIPVLDLPKLSKNEYYIIEASSYQLAYSSKIKFDYAILLNCSESHLEFHKTFNNYLKAKTNIFHKQRRNDVKIIGIDDKSCLSLAIAYKSLNFNVSLVSYETCFFQVVGWQNDLMIDATTYPENIVLTADMIPQFSGEKARQNIAAVYALGIKLKIDPADLVCSIIEAKALNYRCELIARHKNTIFINDSKATNIDSVLNSLSAFKNVFLVIGGEFSEESFDKLIPNLENVERLYIFGKAKDQIISSLGSLKPYYAYDKLSEMMSHDFLASCIDSSQSQKNNDSLDDEKVVLFAPACRSFDEFKDYADRGKYFTNAIKKLITEDKQQAL